MSIPLWRLTTLRRKVFESFGSRRYSRPGFSEIDQALRPFLPEKGFFIEAGAVDGFFESNTYSLERFRCWDGILVEPVPAMYRRISVNRPRARVFNCALVANASATPSVLLSPAHALSTIVSSDPNALPGGSSEGTVRVQGRTLAEIIAEVQPAAIDFLSLDVEGYEAEGNCSITHWAREFVLYVGIELREQVVRQNDARRD